MGRLLPLGRAFFAIALVGLGSHHLLLRGFVTGRAPAWPASVPGEVAWAYATGLLFMAAGIAILAGRHARVAVIVAATPMLFWGVLRHIPVVAGSAWFSGVWTQAGKAVWLVAGSLMVAATFPPWTSDRSPALRKLLNLNREFVVAGRIALAVFLVLTGVQHFLFTPFVASLIPAWFPGDAVHWTWFAGVALIAGGAGLLIPRTARLAASLSGLMIFSWFLIVHVSREFAGVADDISVFEALAAAGLLFVLAAIERKESGDREVRAPHS